MTESIKRTFAVFVEDKPGVLNRVASLFRRRNYNIDSLNVGATHKEGVSRMTVVCNADEDTAKRIEANLYKMVNVLWVDDITFKQTTSRVLALIKVECEPEGRQELLKVCDVFEAKAVDMSLNTLTVEISTPRDKVEGLIKVLEPFGILEMVQTGTVAMTRGVEKQDLAHPTVPTSRINAA